MPTRQQVINFAAQEAKRNGLPPSWFLGLLHAESGFDPDVGAGKRKSSAGAIGYGQLMPGTARGLGVDPFNWQDNIRGSARYLKTQYESFGSLPLALSAYNSGPGGSESSGKIEGFAETIAYVERVKQLEQQYRNFGGAAPAVARDPEMTQMTGAGTPEGPRFTTPPPGESYLESLTRLGPLSARVAGQAAKFQPRQIPENPMPTGEEPESGPTVTRRPMGMDGGAEWQKWVGNIEHVEGPSAPHTPEILQFVGRIGRRAGTVLTPWPNERHSLTTVDGNPSAHGPGRAADIPAKGEELIRLGRLALIEAGADPKWARKQTGGLFNIGKYQVIFNTQIGGDHSNHVHTGLRGG